MTHIKLSGPYRMPLGGKKPEKLVIFLHGVGADGYDLIGLADDILEVLPNSVFLSPHAPFPYENFSLGYQWFSLNDYTPDKLYEGIKQALPILESYIEENLEKYSLQYKDLVLIGFSQGSMIAIQCALRLPEACLAVIAFSGAIIKPEELSKEVKSKPSICLIHGQDDQVVPILKHHLSVKALKEMDISFSDHALSNLGHSINMKALQLAKDFLKEKLNINRSAL